MDCSGLLNREDHLAYMIGYGNGYWGPDNHLCRNETAAIFSRLLKEHLLPATIRPGKWRDVPRASWFYEATCILNDLGIMCGRSDVIFAPEAPITRAEFATVCARFDDREITVLQVFDDIEGHWAEKNIRRAASLGWIKGFPDGMFHPDEYITRAQAAAIINRMLNRTPQSVQDMCHGQLKRWEDVSEKAWYYIDVQEAAHGHTHRKTSDGHEQWIKIIQK